MNFKIFASFVVVCMCCGLLCGSDMSVSYIERGDRLDRLAVPCGVTPGGNVFVGYAWGLVVDHVVCDGLSIGVGGENIEIYEEAKYVARVDGSEYIYMIPAHGDLVCSSESGNPRLYTIPDVWSALELHYRLRSANGALSAQRCVVFYVLGDSDLRVAKEGRVIVRAADSKVCSRHGRGPSQKGAGLNN